MKRAWMIRAERDGRLYDLFKDHSIVAIGWHELGSLADLGNRDAILKRVRQTWPNWKPQSAAMAAGQLHRFRNEIKSGDAVLTYDPRRRVYLVGEASGEYRWDPSYEPLDPNVRSVRWRDEVPRDLLSVASKNSLGAISTLFLVPAAAVEDIERAGITNQPARVDTPEQIEAAEEDVFQNIQAKALEFTKDRVSALGWSEMQELVAGVLRALGYKTRVSAAGPDRGKDIVASPDGFGFEAPRIVVEVKHRQGSIGATDIRSFLGGRHPQEKGLYVSTGGFTKDAYYEAERANIPVALMTLDELVETLVEHYEKLDTETQQLIPLKRIYWPA